MYDFPTDEMVPGMEIMLAFYLVYFLIMMGISVAIYVLQSLSIYTIAKRRGIQKPWLAWIPVGDMWIRGCISDQYRYVVKGQVKNKRKWLLGLSAAMWAVYVVFFAAFGSFMVAVIEDTHATEMFGVAGFFGMGATFLVMMALCVAITVLQYMALYDLYCSCDPNNAVLYLVLGIFVPICQIIFLFVCRKKDAGMPPRRPQPVEPVYTQPIEPWENNSEE